MCISNTRAFVCILCIKRIYHKYHLNHILLLSMYILFIVVSAGIFLAIESRNSTYHRLKWQKGIEYERNKFISTSLFPEIFNNSRLLLYVHGDKSNYLQQIVNHRLNAYERRKLNIRPPVPKFQINFINSMFFVFSTITTTGHSYIQPVTKGGQHFSIFLSLLGIPFTIIVVKDVSYLIAILFNFPCKILQVLWNIFRVCTLKRLKEDELNQELNGENVNIGYDYRVHHTKRLLSIPVTIVIFAIIGWISLGAILMSYAFPHLSMSHNFYFIINSLCTTAVSTIDVPELSLLFFTFYFLYILIGISIVSLFINLLHTKFSQAYWMPGRIYLPLRTQLMQNKNIATFESFEEELTINDIQINHMTTLGIIQTDNKCPLISILKRDQALLDVNTQTGETTAQSLNKILLPTDQSSPPPVTIPIAYRTSHEDVNSIIIEHYDE